jgi:hypothetical protein
MEQSPQDIIARLEKEVARSAGIVQAAMDGIVTFSRESLAGSVLFACSPGVQRTPFCVYSQMNPAIIW